MSRKAVCCCGDSSITVDGDPVFNAVCHCSSCKTRTGSAFGWSAYFPDDKVVEIKGAPQTYSKAGDSGYERHFCKRCGTTLYWKSFAFLPDQTGVAGGCFAGDPLPVPNFSASESGRCVWLNLPEEWARSP